MVQGKIRKDRKNEGRKEVERDGRKEGRGIKKISKERRRGKLKKERSKEKEKRIIEGGMK